MKIKNVYEINKIFMIIYNLRTLVEESPELFSDGINNDIISSLDEVTHILNIITGIK